MSDSKQSLCCKDSNNNVLTLDTSLESVTSKTKSIQERISLQKNGQALDLSLMDIENVPLRDIWSLYGNVTNLDLTYNKIQRLPPDFVGTMMGTLVRLDLSRNKLNRLPDNIGHLQQLAYLDISNNKLSTLPLSICKLNLSYLNINQNPLRPPLNQFVNLDPQNGNFEDVHPVLTFLTAISTTVERTSNPHFLFPVAAGTADLAQDHTRKFHLDLYLRKLWPAIFCIFAIYPFLLAGLFSGSFLQNRIQQMYPAVYEYVWKEYLNQENIHRGAEYIKELITNASYWNIPQPEPEQTFFEAFGQRIAAFFH